MSTSASEEATMASQVEPAAAPQEASSSGAPQVVAAALPTPAAPAPAPAPAPLAPSEPVVAPVPGSGVPPVEPISNQAQPAPPAQEASAVVASSSSGNPVVRPVAPVVSSPAPAVSEIVASHPKGASLKSVSNVFLPAKYKVVFLGDMSVGKTSIIARFMYNTFDKQEHTIGIDFLSKTMQVDDRTLRLQLWDTAGQERYKSLISGYIRESQAAVIVYDTTSRASFDSVEKWVDDVRKHCGQDVVITIAGNKADLTSKRTVTKEEGEAKAQHTNSLFIETSAKTGAGIQNLFTKMATALPTEAASSPLAAPGPAPPPAMNRDGMGGPFSLTAITSSGTQNSGGWCKC